MIKPVFNILKGLVQWGKGSWLKGLVVAIVMPGIIGGAAYLGFDIKAEHDAAKAQEQVQE